MEERPRNRWFNALNAPLRGDPCEFVHWGTVRRWNLAPSYPGCLLATVKLIVWIFFFFRFSALGQVLGINPSMCFCTSPSLKFWYEYPLFLFIIHSTYLHLILHLKLRKKWRVVDESSKLEPIERSYAMRFARSSLPCVAQISQRRVLYFYFYEILVNSTLTTRRVGKQNFFMSTATCLLLFLLRSTQGIATRENSTESKRQLPRNFS